MGYQVIRISYIGQDRLNRDLRKAFISAKGSQKEKVYHY